MKISPDAFRILGLKLVMGFKKEQTGNSINMDNRRFRSNYGVSWSVCSDTWNKLWDTNHPILSQRRVCANHFLWCLMLMKSYNTESKSAGACDTTEKSFCKWSWGFMEAIADLHSEVVSESKTKGERKNFDDFSYCNVLKYD